MAAVSKAQVEVLVIGAGPSGLFAAAELARNGVPTRVVERQPEPHRQALATALQPGTLEILARAEVLNAARPPIAGAAARARSGGSGYDRDGRVLSVSAD